MGGGTVITIILQKPIFDGQPGDAFEVPYISGGDNQVVAQCGCGNQNLGNGEAMIAERGPASDNFRVRSGF